MGGDMLVIWIGALLVISGVVLAAVRTAQRGRLSDVPRPAATAGPDTLEPAGRGRRLAIKADLPGLALIALGAVLLLVGAF
jgi:hypothetical protein